MRRALTRVRTFRLGRVPKVYPANPKLVSWCQNQRAHHRAFLLGKKTFMDAARKKQLEEVGFEWETGATPGRPPSEKKKRARKKKEEVHEEESESEEEMESMHGLGHDDLAVPTFANPGTFAPAPPLAAQMPPPQTYQNHPFAHPNHAYANPYQQQQQQQQQQQHQPRHFYPTL